MDMHFIIRELKPSEYSLLENFLYEAIFQPDINNLAPRSIIKKPELQVYIKDFGQKDDYCLCTEVNGTIIGAVWIRNINGYGNIDDTTPEFAISLYREYRGHGIGTAMMKEMLNYLKQQNYRKVSLAVQKNNYATKMYLNLGFRIIDENEEEYIMVYYFSDTIIENIKR